MSIGRHKGKRNMVRRREKKIFFSSGSRLFLLYEDFTSADERLQNIGQFSALMTFEQGGITISSDTEPRNTWSYPKEYPNPHHKIPVYPKPAF